MMATYDVAIPAPWRARVGQDTPSAITEYLTGQGVVVGAVSVRTDPATGAAVALVIDADRDPTADLDGWQPPQSPHEKALARLETYLQIYRDGGTPTPAQVARAVKALAALRLNAHEDMD